MAAYFENRTQNGFYPDYEGIDWYELRIIKLGQKALRATEVWLCVPEHGATYEQQITQDNTFIQLNEVMPEMDRIMIRDERDDSYWMRYRSENNIFDEMCESIEPHARLIHTLYPQKDVVQKYIKRQLGDLDKKGPTKL